MKNDRPIRAITAALALCAAGSACCAADSYPHKSIRMIVPYPAAGTTDLLARILAPRATELFGQSIVIDNRSGAGGIIGTGIAAKAAPDGYTLLMVYDSFAVNPITYKNLPYDNARDFAPISQLAASPLVFLVTPRLGVDSLKDLIAAARAKPGAIRYSTGGRGSSSHLTPEMLKLRAGIDMTHLPFAGAGTAINSLLTGDAHVICVGTLAAIPLVKAGRLKALAVSSLKRAAQLPELPTVAESGYAGFEANAWYGLLAPAGTPPAVIKTVHAAFVRAAQNPAAAAQIAEQGGEMVLSSPEQFRDFLRAETAKWGKVIKDANITFN
jgi:tripartite-type tricarboxylate transporter receptor subunit TctC